MINAVGITPACAGNSDKARGQSPEGRDHPRLRGEQSLPPYNGKIGVGSPPLARGTAACRGYADMRHGITPACAGNRRTGQGARLRPWDHPRLRGEQVSRPKPLHTPIGSPPLARGTAAQCRCIRTSGRITPACAGNSDKARGQSPEGRDHPRLRGEQEKYQVRFRINLGSPPLARGTAYDGAARASLGGITPACAGNSLPEPPYLA